MHILDFIIVIPITALTATVYLRYYFSSKQVVTRKLKKAIGTSMNRFTSGEVAKVAGKVEFSATPLIAPLSGRPCCYYQLKIEMLRGADNNRHWSTIVEDEQSSEFLVFDGKNRAYFEKDDLKSHLVQNWNLESGILNDASGKMDIILSKYGYSSTNFLGMNHSIRYHEGVLEAGETVALVGRGTWKRGSELGLKINDRVLVIDAPDTDHVYLSDDPESVQIKYQNLTEVESAFSNN